MQLHSQKQCLNSPSRSKKTIFTLTPFLKGQETQLKASKIYLQCSMQVMLLRKPLESKHVYEELDVTLLLKQTRANIFQTHVTQMQQYHLHKRCLYLGTRQQIMHDVFILEGKELACSFCLNPWFLYFAFPWISMYCIGSA